MKFKFSNLPDKLKSGLGLLAPDYSFTLCESGMPVDVAPAKGKDSLRILVKDGKATIEYANPCHFYRAMGLLLEGQTDYSEQGSFDTVGIMFDMSQGNSVILPERMEGIIRRMAVMGYNMLMLYMEDSYALPGHPYFGYMRPKYDFNDFIRIDNYAYKFGIEVVPFIEGLAHLTDVLKWDVYSEIRDNDDMLLVGEEKTYEFVEDEVRYIETPFRSKKIHIGMDEAWRLGKDRYRDINGDRPKFDIMKEHLDRLVEITENHGFEETMIWSDMYFRTSKLGGYGNNFDPDAPLPDDVENFVPTSTSMIFWEYNRTDAEFYEKCIRLHKGYNRKLYFASGIYSCHGFNINNGLAYQTIPVQLDVCRKEGLRDIFLTVWGDDATESNIDGLWSVFQFYAEQAYNPGLDNAQLSKRFDTCVGGVHDDFFDIRRFDEIPGVISEGNPYMCNPSRFLVWQNAMLGLFDKDTDGLGLNAYYGKLRDELTAARGRNPKFDDLFAMYEQLADVLSFKAELGLKLRKAYLDGNKAALTNFANSVIPALIEKYAKLRITHRDYWFTTNKPQGWEIIDLRYGTQLNWLETAIYRIKGYLDGCFDSLGELEEERQPIPYANELPFMYSYKRIASASRISHF